MKQILRECGWRYDNNLEPNPGRLNPDQSVNLPTGWIFESEETPNTQWILYYWEKDNTVWIEKTINSGSEGYIFKGVINDAHDFFRVCLMVGVQLK